MYNKMKFRIVFSRSKKRNLSILKNISWVISSAIFLCNKTRIIPPNFYERTNHPYSPSDRQTQPPNPNPNSPSRMHYFCLSSRQKDAKVEHSKNSHAAAIADPVRPYTTLRSFTGCNSKKDQCRSIVEYSFVTSNTSSSIPGNTDRPTGNLIWLVAAAAFFVVVVCIIERLCVWLQKVTATHLMAFCRVGYVWSRIAT